MEKTISQLKKWRGTEPDLDLLKKYGYLLEKEYREILPNGQQIKINKI